MSPFNHPRGILTGRHAEVKLCPSYYKLERRRSVGRIMRQAIVAEDERPLYRCREKIPAELGTTSIIFAISVAYTSDRTL